MNACRRTDWTRNRRGPVVAASTSTNWALTSCESISHASPPADTAPRLAVGDGSYCNPRPIGHAADLQLTEALGELDESLS